ncbi:hypothetical protein Dimus_011140, partial [Dionaea muscipula]
TLKKKMKQTFEAMESNFLGSFKSFVLRLIKGKRWALLCKHEEADLEELEIKQTL